MHLAAGRMLTCAPFRACAGRPVGDGLGVQLLNGDTFWQTALPRGCPTHTFTEGGM